jgi:hypothetical protein
VRTISAERLETEVAVILGVETHLDFHVGLWAWTIWAGAWAGAWASRACQRPRRVTGGSSTLHWAEDFGPL